ncbi:fasciclin domain-containing protein [Chroococcidiopsis sp. CCMEE 29]|uniref:fasciclin domain-containing protein n=1 Tax=Chroococcidiopsis sp. CCMEE 29 TaxID=155894 RepID=UPI0020203B23|nr:fasciclin domain-containing protein [Chroococcidiopsis sp. CCMEE 29]
MYSLFRWSSASVALLAFGVTASAVVPIMISATALAQATAPTPTPTPTAPASPVPNFPDVPADFWAQPFIQALATRNVITGFPNGTFRPEEPVDRAEFAAMIASAFNQNAVRQLAPGGFKDVPPDYWAVSVIEEAYETGFMSGYPGNLFLPNQEIPKVQAIVALANGLGLTPTGTVANVLDTYYTDAGIIPDYALDDVAAATEANVVVNYPNVRVLNPLTPLTRAEAAALLYQALVRLGQVQPLPANVTAANYIVGGTPGASQSTPPTPTMASRDIVALAASSNSFTTLTSALKAAGLAETLQGEGPFTLFAPTDEAFAALPKGTLQRLLQPENRETLARILRYHVVPGAVTASELSAGELKTLADRPVNIQIDPATNEIAVNDARVLQPNVRASNGVIHVVNEVLLPPNFNLKTNLR